jgi:hypothetical protein
VYYVDAVLVYLARIIRAHMPFKRLVVDVEQSPLHPESSVFT